MFPKRKVDPLWTRPEGGWPKVFDTEPKVLAQEDIEKIERELKEEDREFQKQLALYQNPITNEVLWDILG